MFPVPPPGDYYGTFAPYTNLYIGCDSTTKCFKGRIDEVRISNIQRTFEWTVVPTVTPTPTWTPVSSSGEYSVDQYTRALYHLNFSTSSGILEQVSQTYKPLSGAGAFVVPNGRYNSGLRLNDSSSSAFLGDHGPFDQGTVEAWVNYSSTTASGPILAYPEYNGNARSLLFLGPSPASTIGFNVYTGSGSYWVDSGVTAASLAGCWHHIAGTWGPRGLEIWIDGTLRQANPTMTGSMPWTNPHWRLGCNSVGSCMTGTLDELRISTIQRTFTLPSLAPKPGWRSSQSSETLTFLPIIQVAPTRSAPACPFGP
jgi:hypothetical protein